jgi:hypothetical protein
MVEDDDDKKIRGVRTLVMLVDVLARGCHQGFARRAAVFVHEHPAVCRLRCTLHSRVLGGWGSGRSLDTEGVPVHTPTSAHVCSYTPTRARRCSIAQNAWEQRRFAKRAC